MAKDVSSEDCAHARSIVLGLECLIHNEQQAHVPKETEERYSYGRQALLCRFGMEVKSGAACQVEDLSSQPGGFDAKCGLSTPGKERRLKAIPEWQLQPCKSTRGQRDSIAAIVCAWQTPSEAAALLEATVMQPMP